MFFEYILLAQRSLWTHKARALLTMLGVIIGVFSVTMLISLGAGARNEAARQIRSLGSNLVMVTVTDQHGYLPRTWLTDLQDRASISEYSVVLRSSSSFSINGRDFNATVYGVNEHYAYISSLPIYSGRFFNGLDVQNNVAVAVIGRRVATNLFRLGDPVGQTILIKGIPFRIIGVLDEQGASFAGDLDRVIYIPSGFSSVFTTQSRTKTYYVASVSEEATNLTAEHIEAYLDARLPSSRLYSVISQTQMLNVLDQIMGLLTTLLAGIAAISLLVGGIGIMNIMLVTVRERTREIGIRKALGATRANILWQFLIEAILITATGGMIGLLISMIGAYVVSILSGFTVTVGMDAALFALVFSILIGVAFGLYPANKAGQLAPVDALRFE